MDLRNTRTIILNAGDASAKREEIRQYFHATYSLDEQLYETLASEAAFYLRPEPLRHPLIFYLGHTATFYINKLIVAKITNQRINPRFESMFAVGVDEMSWDDLNAANYDWPTLAEVKAYRDTVRAVVDETIRTMPLVMPIHWDNPFWVILMGIEHQRIHIETSSVIIRRLPIELVRQLPLWSICPLAGEAPANELVPVAGGRVVLGKSKDHPLYGWDNEFGRQENEVWDFAASRYLVSNREYLGFVEDRGYEQEQFWTHEGWKWVGFSKARHPLFWIDSPDGYRFRTMAQIIDMPWDWPAEVNYLEAKAFCNWLASKTGKPIRLPTEAEWYRLRDLHDIPDQPYWQKAPGNINLEHWASSCPVSHFRFGEFFDIIGNVWQWTETPITGFDGFQIHPYYDDFSTPTFDTQHNLIKGGSWISTGNEATRDSRYAFRRHFFQHAGLRYVQSEQPFTMPEAMYETDSAVSQYCEFHYGQTLFRGAEFCGAMCCGLRPLHAAATAAQSLGPGLRRGAGHVRVGEGIRACHRDRFFGPVHPRRPATEGERRRALRTGRGRGGGFLPRGPLVRVGPRSSGRPRGILPGRRHEPQAAIHRLRFGPGRESDRSAVRSEAISGDDSRAAESGGCSGHHLALHLAGGIHQKRRTGWAVSDKRASRIGRWTPSARF